MITTKWKIIVREYDHTGYYYPVYRTEVTVIADTKEEALEKALDRVPRRSYSSGYVQKASVMTFEDIVFKEDQQ